MNKEEIDNILSRLERIDHKEYSCSFEFADSGSFEETCMCFDERKKLANYIKDLQQENKQLKDNWNRLEEYLNSYIMVMIKQPDFIEQGQIDILYEVKDMMKEILGDSKDE